MRFGDRHCFSVWILLSTASDRDRARIRRSLSTSNALVSQLAYARTHLKIYSYTISTHPSLLIDVHSCDIGASMKGLN